MRALLGLAASLLLPIAAAGAQAPPAGERYTPTGIWRDADWAEPFFERWFGDQLRAMDEPVLAGPDDLGRFRSRFRLLVLPNSDPGWTIRIDERSTGDGIVTYVRLDGAGGYAPGNVAERHRSTIDRADMALLRSELRRLRFSQLPAEEPPPPQQECGEDECTISICFHATKYVFERIDRDGRHFVARNACEMEPGLQRLYELLMPLRERD
jgi:hypothetical protein